MRLEMLPRVKVVLLLSDGLMPNFSGLVMGVGGRVILGEDSLMDLVMELSLSDLDMEDTDLSSSSIIWRSSAMLSRPLFSDTGDSWSGGAGTELVVAITRGCLARLCLVLPMMRS